MTTLEAALAIEAAGPGRWRGRSDPAYEGAPGMFGGWTAAILLKSVLAASGGEGAPVFLTVQFMAPVTAEAAIEIATDRAGGGRSLSFWRAGLSVAGQPGTLAMATVVIADRRRSDGFTDIAMPEAPDPLTLPIGSAPGPFGERTEMRFVRGLSMYDQPDTRSLAWKRETSGRPLDHVQLAFLCDLCPPRIFYKSPGPRPVATITLQLNFHATPDELAAVGDDFVLSEDFGTRAEASTEGSQQRLWSRAGALLASSDQLRRYR